MTNVDFLKQLFCVKDSGYSVYACTRWYEQSAFVTDGEGILKLQFGRNTSIIRIHFVFEPDSKMHRRFYKYLSLDTKITPEMIKECFIAEDKFRTDNNLRYYESLNKFKGDIKNFLYYEELGDELFRSKNGFLLIDPWDLKEQQKIN